MNATVVAIAGAGGYSIAPRFNPGSALPSDFAVIVVRKRLGTNRVVIISATRTGKLALVACCRGNL